MYASIDELQEAAADMQGMDPDYYEKQITQIPDAPVVDRVGFILDRCKGKVVLNIGSASGNLHEKIKGVAKEIRGVDKEVSPNTDYVVDLDASPDSLLNMISAFFDLVVCGEIVEHLSNPGSFLKTVKFLNAPLLITVPNAFAMGGRENVQRGIENCNKDHVAYYSYVTLTRLLEKSGFQIKEWYWYNGMPRVSEGMIAVAEVA